MNGSTYIKLLPTPMEKPTTKRSKFPAILKPVLKNFFLIILDVAVMIGTLSLIAGYYVYANTPLPAGMPTAKMDQTTLIYDRTGQYILYKIYGDQNRQSLKHNQIPDDIRIATIASEDSNFYSHGGIDVKSIARAALTDWQSGSFQEGGSTITQQLVRSLYLSPEKTFRRKAIEAILAIKFEKQYSKDQILDMYLNDVPYGHNAYGIETAAETYFGIHADKLTLDEAAFLAALPNAPTYYSPYGGNTQALVARQQNILNRIAELKLADPQMITAAKKVDTLAKIIPLKDSIQDPHFVFYVKQQLEQMYGKDKVKNGGLKVYTSLDYNLQNIAQKDVTQGAAYNSKAYNANNAALVAIDPKTGQILAMVGGPNFWNTASDGQVNAALALRSPGSSFKPFVYSEAFLKGYQPDTLLLDASTNFGPDGSGRNYIPRNYDGRSHGVVTMRQALGMSLNIPAVKTLYLAGINDTINLAEKMGITTLDPQKIHYGLALAIGGGDVTLLDETSGYSVFANDGQRNPATPFVKIEDSSGKIIYQPQPENEQVLDPQVARKISSILSDNAARTPMFGPNSKLVVPGYAVAAKTGTSQDFRDGWTVGYTPDLAVGVWTGNNNNSPFRSGADGVFVAAPIWNNFMTAALKDYPKETFLAYNNENSTSANTQSGNFKIVYFDKKTGKVLSGKKLKKADPANIGTRVEYAG
ncbi:MAG: PBP1A family penicillin-binding protein, partial [Candidatus Pacebacteria bacterium]|nr:PBP1A family penicillin-binding protein [Candidatus Paceibacterota bacterium]